MSNLKAVFWDIDGTLADTEMMGHRLAFNEAFKRIELKWNWDKNLYKELLSIGGGKNRIRSYSKTIDYKISEKKINNIHLLKTKIYENIVQSGNILLREGVKRLLKDLYKNGFKQFIVTTSSRSSVESLINYSLTNTNIEFDGIISSSDVKRQKPDPECYSKAIRLSSVGINNIVVIEDSLIGLRSCKSAHLKCILTLNEWSDYNINDLESADTIVNSLGSKSNPAKFVKGPESESGFIDANYIDKLLYL